MKKILCAAFLVSSMCMNAFAAADVSVVGNKVTVEVDIEAEKWGTLIVTKSGKSLDNENIIAMKQAVADENGKAIFNFSMPATLEGGVNGKYDLHIKNGSKDVYIESMYYVLPADRSRIIEELKNGTDIKAVLENDSNKEIFNALGVHLDIYEEFKQADTQNQNTELTDSVCNAFIDARTGDMSDAEIIELLNGMLVIQKINVSSDNNIETIEKLGYSFENTDFASADSATKNFVGEYIYLNKPYSSIAQVKKVYETASMLNVINNTRFNDMESKLAGYAGGLGIENNAVYKSYINAANKTEINEDIVTSLKQKDAVSVAELLSVIDKAVKDNTKNVISGGGGGGGSSSGGSSSGSSTMDTPPNPLATPPGGNSIRKFSDIADVAWANDAIYAMAKKNIIVGDESGRFNPNNFVKREEFVKMLVMAAGIYNPDARCTLQDVEADAWYHSYVASAFNSNVVYGTSQNAFGIGENITRQDMAVMCYRVAKDANILKKIRQGSGFADEQNISEYARESVSALYEAGGINGVGDNMFDPMGTATRAQAAVMIYNLFVK